MNLASFVEQHARIEPRRPAIEFRGQSLTYGELNLAARRVAAALRAKGAGAGSVVAVAMVESPAHVAALLGAARVGAIVLPLDWRATPSECARLAERFKPTVVLVDDKQILMPGCGVITAGEMESVEPDTLPPAVLSRGTLTFGISSGTTGQPKAMIVAHETMHARFANIATAFPLLREDRFLAALPLAFAAGQIFLFAALCAGATIVQLPAMYDAAELVKIVRDKKVSVLHLPPNATRSLLALGEGQSGMLMPELRLFISGTGGLSTEERARVRARIAPRLLALYGCAGGGPICLLSNEVDAVAPQSAGLPLPSIDVQVVDDSGTPVAAGESGWVRLRGPAIISEIMGGDPNAEEGVRDGWYYPGDVGRFDDAGHLYLLGRSADLIKRGGRTVYSQEVEHVLMAHDAVREAAVIGVPGGDIGEDVVAFVKLSREADPRELLVHCRKHLATYKLPSQIRSIDEFPRNTSGKVLKNELKRRVNA